MRLALAVERSLVRLMEQLQVVYKQCAAVTNQYSLVGARVRGVVLCG